MLAVGRKDTGEPLNSEDMGLLAAVAGQIATALENARLYRQLHVKALELDRMRAFNENILESLDDGLLVLDLNDRVVRWNPRDRGALRRARKATQPAAGSTSCSTRRSSKRFARRGAMRRRERRCPGCSSDAAATAIRLAADRQRRRRAAARIGEIGITTVGTIVIIEDVTRRVQLEEQLQISEKMASIGLLAAGVAHEVNTPLTGISSFTQMLLEGADPDDPKTQAAREDRTADVPGREDRQRPAESVAAGARGAADVAAVDVNTVIADVLSLLEHQFAAAAASRSGAS